MDMKSAGWWLAVGAVAGSIGASALSAAEVTSWFSLSGDERIREEYRNRIPNDKPAEQDYWRFRTRVWADARPASNVAARLRLVNETRNVDKPAAHSGAKYYEWPDEWVFDNAYLDLRGLLDNKLDLRLGRQDLVYGNGRVIGDGTAGDGSRTIYCNALKAVWRGVRDTTIDLFGIYNDAEDELALNSAQRDLNAYSKAVPANSVAESGIGVYLANRTYPAMPIELYAIFKQESEYHQATNTAATGAGVTLNDAQTAYVIPEGDIGTVGFRVVPRFTSELQGSLEGAYQFGTRGDAEIGASMVDGKLTYQVPLARSRTPELNGGLYYLSGDDPATKDRDEGWDPLWARYIYFSDLLSYSLQLRWTNLIMPYVGAAFSPTRWLRTSALAAYLGADRADGVGDNTDRGFLYAAKAEFTIMNDILVRRDSLTGHVQVEMLDPGDYYASDNEAYFMRWQLLYAF
jgi:hypothetical protein